MSSTTEGLAEIAFRSAENALRRIKVPPASVVSAEYLGRCELAAGFDPQGVISFLDPLALQGDVLAKVARGKIELARGRVAEAVDYFNLTRAESPHFALNFGLELVEALAKTNDHRALLAASSQIAGLNPENLALVARTKYRIEDDTYYDDFSLARELAKNSRTLGFAAIRNAECGRYEEAKRTLERIPDTLPVTRGVVAAEIALAGLERGEFSPIFEFAMGDPFIGEYLQFEPQYLPELNTIGRSMQFSSDLRRQYRGLIRREGKPLNFRNKRDAQIVQARSLAVVGRLMYQKGLPYSNIAFDLSHKIGYDLGDPIDIATTLKILAINLAQARQDGGFELCEAFEILKEHLTKKRPEDQRKLTRGIGEISEVGRLFVGLGNGQDYAQEAVELVEQIATSKPEYYPLLTLWEADIAVIEGVRGLMLSGVSPKDPNIQQLIIQGPEKNFAPRNRFDSLYS